MVVQSLGIQYHYVVDQALGMLLKENDIVFGMSSVLSKNI